MLGGRGVATLNYKVTEQREPEMCCTLACIDQGVIDQASCLFAVIFLQKGYRVLTSADGL